MSSPQRALRKCRPTTKLLIDPASQEWLKKRLASPEGKALLLELARTFARAAVDNLMREAAVKRCVSTAKSSFLLTRPCLHFCAAPGFIIVVAGA